MIRRLLTPAAGLLVLAAVVLLFLSDQIDLGTKSVHESPYEAAAWPLIGAVLASLAAVVLAARWRPARVPVALMIWGSVAVVGILAHTPLVSLEDGDIVIAFVPACVVALWLLATGGRAARGWSSNAALRGATYLTAAITIGPFVAIGGAGATCAGASSDDDLCGIAGAYLGLLGTAAFVGCVIVALEVANLVGRHRRPEH